MRKALITGVTGQDGSYMIELLLGKGYKVYGLIHRSSHEPTDRISHLLDRITLIEGDLADQSSLQEAVRTAKPDEIYNLASQSFIPTSWKQPVLTGDVTGLGVARLLEVLRMYRPETRFYQASSSEMFGKVREVPQSETTPFYPLSPYGVAKAYAHYLTVNYRENYGLYACSGICFNHESPRRGVEYVTHKITIGAAKIKLGMATELILGNLDGCRDWGFAGDYVEAMWRMLQQDKPDDYVIATGELHSVREFVNAAFELLELDYKKYVRTDPNLIRAAEVNRLVGNPAKAKARLGWQPQISFKELVGMMVKSDIQMLEAGQEPTFT
jgi:GDPmannose 4,6-dehydratase